MINKRLQRPELYKDEPKMVVTTYWMSQGGG
jgi:hypothetical protein